MRGILTGVLIRSFRFTHGRAWLAFLAIALGAPSCSRNDERAPKAEPSSADSVAQAAALPPTGDETRVKPPSEPQPDFVKHPPVQRKPPCESSSEKAASDGEKPCITATLRCSELDPGESVWLLTTPAVAKVRLPEGAKGLRVTEDDRVSATICCRDAPPGSGVRGPVKAQVRLFTNEVAGSLQQIDCP